MADLKIKINSFLHKRHGQINSNSNSNLVWCFKKITKIKKKFILDYHAINPKFNN
jgi:hypothetical protein